MTKRSTDRVHHQESFEVVPEWQQGEPVPRYLPPSKGTLRRLADAVREGLGLKESSPPPSPADQRAQNIANTVRAQLGNKLGVSFTTFTAIYYTKKEEDDSEYGGEGTLYTIQVKVAPSIEGHNSLQIQVFTSSSTREDALVHYHPS